MQQPQHQPQHQRPTLKPVGVDAIPLPEHRQKQVEAGLSAYQTVMAERDQFERQLREAIVKIDSLTQQLSHMQGVVNLMESAYMSAKADLEGRVRDYQQQRDAAVTKSATLEAHLVSIQSALNNALVHEPT